MLIKLTTNTTYNIFILQINFAKLSIVFKLTACLSFCPLVLWDFLEHFTEFEQISLVNLVIQLIFINKMVARNTFQMGISHVFLRECMQCRELREKMSQMKKKVNIYIWKLFPCHVAWQVIWIILSFSEVYNLQN